MNWLLTFVAPIVAGFGLNWVGGKSKGRNAKNGFRLAAWGCWLLLLGNLAGIGPIPPIFGIGFLLNLIIWLAPAAICFLLAASSIVKEMRAQKNGEFTDAA